MNQHKPVQKPVVLVELLWHGLQPHQIVDHITLALSLPDLCASDVSFTCQDRGIASRVQAASPTLSSRLRHEDRPHQWCPIVLVCQHGVRPVVLGRPFYQELQDFPVALYSSPVYSSQAVLQLQIREPCANVQKQIPTAGTEEQPYENFSFFVSGKGLSGHEN